MPASPAPAFTPTAAQLRLLDYVHANPGFQRITDLCAEAGVDPSSYYKWCHEPSFRDWLTAEWSSRLIFEGWHFLNLARANCTNSATHFRVLMNLIFDPKGQAALAAWQKLASSSVESPAPAPPMPRSVRLESQPQPIQQNFSSNSSFSAFSPVGPQTRLNPGMVARHLSRQIARLQPRKRALPHPRPRPTCHARAAQPASRPAPPPPAPPAPGGIEPPQPPHELLELAKFDFSNPYARPLLRQHFADVSGYLRGLSRYSPK